MAKNILDQVPFPPLVRINTSTPITETQMRDLLQNRPEGISFCVRRSDGVPLRGGYFFHVRPGGDDFSACGIFNFERLLAGTLAIEELTAFINHCSGLKFNDEAFALCQTQINFRLDPQPEEEEPAEVIEEA